jgi:galactonate dehydratase
MTAKLRAIDLFPVRASAKTVWVFLRAIDTAGHIGWGEATWIGHERELSLVFARFAPVVIGAPATPEGCGLTARDGCGTAEAAIVSAIDQALWDVAARASDKPVHAMIAPGGRTSIPMYANINRRTMDRSPDGFAASARKANKDGFDTVKMAPFDGVVPGKTEGITQALARVAAVREAIGKSRKLYVDCHWRFDEAIAAETFEALAEIGIDWFECPIAETSDNIPALKRLRARANAKGVPLAGLEMGTGVDGFREYLDAGTYDAIMPDAKYAGGFAEFNRIAEYALARGTNVSPHNPSGPICHVASLHLCAGLPGFSVLEHQYDESPVFDAILTSPFPRPQNGAAPIPEGSGWGLALDMNQLSPDGAFKRLGAEAAICA